MTKSRTFDLDDVLKRAASSGQHGSNRVRSGQIDEPMLQMQRVAGRLAREAQDAYGVWANWEAINSALCANSKLREALQFHDVDWNMGPIRTSFLRDAIYRHYRNGQEIDKKPTFDDDDREPLTDNTGCDS